MIIMGVLLNAQGFFLNLQVNGMESRSQGSFELGEAVRSCVAAGNEQVAKMHKFRDIFLKYPQSVVFPPK